MKSKPAIIITKKDVEEVVSRIWNAFQQFKKENHTPIHNKKIPNFFSTAKKFEGELNVIVFRDVFQNYRDYDGFLIYLVQENGFWSFNKEGVLLGHFDESGYLWTDYQHFIKYGGKSNESQM